MITFGSISEVDSTVLPRAIGSVRVYNSGSFSDTITNGATIISAEESYTTYNNTGETITRSGSGSSDEYGTSTSTAGTSTLTFSSIFTSSGSASFTSTAHFGQNWVSAGETGISSGDTVGSTSTSSSSSSFSSGSHITGYSYFSVETTAEAETTITTDITYDDGTLNNTYTDTFTSLSTWNESDIDQVSIVLPPFYVLNIVAVFQKHDRDANLIWMYPNVEAEGHLEDICLSYGDNFTLYASDYYSGGSFFVATGSGPGTDTVEITLPPYAQTVYDTGSESGTVEATGDGSQRLVYVRFDGQSFADDTFTNELTTSYNPTTLDSRDSSTVTETFVLPQSYTLLGYSPTTTTALSVSFRDAISRNGERQDTMVVTLNTSTEFTVTSYSALRTGYNLSSGPGHSSGASYFFTWAVFPYIVSPGYAYLGHSYYIPFGGRGVVPFQTGTGASYYERLSASLLPETDTRQTFPWGGYMLEWPDVSVITEASGQSTTAFRWHALVEQGLLASAMLSTDGAISDVLIYSTDYNEAFLVNAKFSGADDFHATLGLTITNFSDTAALGQSLGVVVGIANGSATDEMTHIDKQAFRPGGGRQVIPGMVTRQAASGHYYTFGLDSDGIDNSGTTFRSLETVEIPTASLFLEKLEQVFTVRFATAEGAIGLPGVATTYIFPTPTNELTGSQPQSFQSYTGAL